MKHRIFKRYKTRKRGGQHYWVGRKPKNFAASFTLQRVRSMPGKKTQLLQLREDIEENLSVPDISRERRIKLSDKLENLNQQLKRIQGQPPTEPVTGRFPSELKLGFLQRYKGTSSRRPQFIEEMDLPLKENIPKNKERLRQRAKEHFGIKKGLDVLYEKSLKDIPKDTQISLEDLKKYKRQNFGSVRLLPQEDINKHLTKRLIDKLKEHNIARFFKGSPANLETINKVQKSNEITPDVVVTRLNLSPKTAEAVMTIRDNKNFYTIKGVTPDIKTAIFRDTAFVSDTEEEAKKIHKRLADEALSRLNKK